MKRRVFVCLLLCLSTIGLSATAAPARRTIRGRASAGDRPGIRRAALDSQCRCRSRQHPAQRHALLRALFHKRGFTAEILQTEGNPLVFAELQVPGGATHAALLRALRRPAGRPERLEPGQPVHARAAERRGSKTAGRIFRISSRCGNFRQKHGSTRARPRMTRLPSSRCSRLSTRWRQRSSVRRPT